MKILNLKRLIGLAAIGGVAYAHKQRGGEWTLDRVKDTLRHLWTTANEKLTPMKNELRDTLDRAAHVSETATRSGMSDEPRTYGYRRPDDTDRH
ncbi:MAG: hypothetical protein ABIY55_24750 [Kofleriaceae bacterium]